MSNYYTHNNIEIEINKKKIKNFNLKVKNDCSVVCSIPLNTTNEELTEFINNKTTWICKNIQKFKKLKKIKCFNILKNGGSVKILGYDYRVNISYSEIFNIEINDSDLIIKSPKNEQKYIQNKFDVFIRKYMLSYYSNKLEKLYPIVKKYNVNKPNLKIRKMQTCWGTCNQATNSITLNEYLFRTFPMCIEYIILHELTHLLYTYHNKDFYNFVELNMPDWKERKNILNNEFTV